MNSSALSPATMRGGTIPTICACCGVLFQARSVLAAYCGVNCRRRAGYYRRLGRAIPAKRAWTQPIRPVQVVQPEILGSPDDLPAIWQQPEAAAMEVRQWQGTQIQRRESDGYVNATAMCQANGRRWTKFRESAQCQLYMQALAAEDRISVFALVDSQRGGNGAGGETWIHPDLATELARWISPAFSVFVNRWFRSEVEAGHRPTPSRPPLPKGIHVIADTKREAAEFWWDAISQEVIGILGRRLNPRTKTDAGLPRRLAYHWQQPSLL